MAEGVFGLYAANVFIYLLLFMAHRRIDLLQEKDKRIAELEEVINATLDKDKTTSALKARITELGDNLTRTQKAYGVLEKALKQIARPKGIASHNQAVWMTRRAQDALETVEKIRNESPCL